MDFKLLTSNVRFYVLLLSLSLSIFFYLWVKDIYELIRIYALLSVTYLYFTLLATPLTRTFTFLPFRGQYVKARRALGVSAFYFALLHATLAFFNNIGGFSGLFSLSGKFLLVVIFGIISLTILALMTATASDIMIDKLGFKRWKLLHRLVYLVAILTLFHALTLGSHFQSLSGLIPKVFLIAIVMLGVLESMRFLKYLKGKFGQNN